MAGNDLWSSEKIKEEFHKKDRFLSERCVVIPPETFYEEIFFDYEVTVPYRRTGENAFIRKIPLDTALSSSSSETNVVLHTCSFRNHYPKKSLAIEVFALVVDLDRVPVSLLQDLILDGWKDMNGRSIPLPTYIVNSGAGIHLYFLFDEAVTYSSDRAGIDRLNRALCVAESCLPDIVMDYHAISQGYRIVGSLTKFGERVYAYAPPGSKRWSPSELAAELGIKLSAPSDRDQIRQLGLYADRRVTPMPKRSTSRIPERWNTPRSIYDALLVRCYRDVGEGRRYLSMAALTVMAYKCFVPMSELAEDLSRLVWFFNSQSPSVPVSDREISNALKLYNAQATTVRSSVLEEWFGFSFNHYNRHDKADRFPRKKTDEMRKNGSLTNLEARGWSARDEMYPDGSWRENAGRKPAKDKILDWRSKNPAGSIEDCSKETGFCTKTVRKWWKQKNI